MKYKIKIIKVLLYNIKNKKWYEVYIIYPFIINIFSFETIG